MKNGRSALFAEGLRELYDLPYRDDGDPRHTLDLIRPEGEGVLPVIAEIHGGAYIACEKNINRLHARAFARQGFAVVNGDYTLHPEGSFRQNMQELADLFSWIGQNATRYGLDTEHVYLSGDSAGGHLVLLYAMLQGSEKMQEHFGVRPGPVRVRAAAPTCPAFRLCYESGHPKRAVLDGLIPLLFPDGVTDEELGELDVLQWLHGSAYPPLIVTATPSDDILYEEDLILAGALEANGRAYSFRLWEEKGNRLGHVFNVLFPELEESEAANRAIVDFFRAQG
jgi:acetyl esterase/lipase